jgi:hypothetical protein
MKKIVTHEGRSLGKVGIDFGAGGVTGAGSDKGSFS